MAMWIIAFVLLFGQRLNSSCGPMYVSISKHEIKVIVKNHQTGTSKFWLPRKGLARVVAPKILAPEWTLSWAFWLPREYFYSRFSSQENIFAPILAAKRTLLHLLQLPRGQFCTIWLSKEHFYEHLALKTTLLHQFWPPREQFWKNFDSRKNISKLFWVPTELVCTIWLQRENFHQHFGSQENSFMSILAQEKTLWTYLAPRWTFLYHLAPKRALLHLFWLPRGQFCKNFRYEEGAFPHVLAPESTFALT